MDELTMVRELLAEPAPSPQVVAEGRERLLGSAAGAVPPERRLKRPALRSAVLALGVTGAAAAAALAVATMGAGPGASPGGGARVATGGSARTVLLAAAVKAESDSTAGRYWHVRSVARTTLPRKFGHGAHRYTLEQLSVTENWSTHTGRSWLGRREWVRPKTAQDEAAWRRDGAPSTWCIGQTDTSPPQPICLRTAPGTASLTRIGQDTFQITEGHDLTFKQLQRLPGKPAALRAWLVRIARHHLDPSAGTAVIDLNVENELSDLLVYYPVPPRVRAAAFRALAGMPGVVSTGPTHDELGRPGVGIELKTEHAVAVLGGGSAVAATGKLTRTLIIDPATSHVLADQMRIGDRSEPAIDSLILEVGWTNERPHNPAFPDAVPPAREALRA
jgi:hypothetical protein